VEVLSIGTARHDSTVKLSWYQQYGVRECWLIDPVAIAVNVVDFTGATRSCQVCTEHELVQSRVLPVLRLKVGDLFQS
jgi:Uma2 family endonuclease